MSDKLSCNVVRDLLPSYVDGLLSDESKNEVDVHLADCSPCTAVLESMREPEQPEKEEKQIDYLKKTRKRTALIIISCIAIAAVVVWAGALVAFRAANTSKNFDIYGLIYNVAVGGKEAHITVDLADSWRGTKIKAKEENGVLLLDVTASPGGSGRSTLDYTAREEITEVRIGDITVWQDGCFLDSNVAMLYHAKNPYVGDISADLRIASLLGVENDLGSFSNELHTSEEPYGWTITLHNSIPERNRLVAESIMTKDAAVMFALIDNLGYVNWEYTVNGENTGLVCGRDGLLDGRNADTPREFVNLLSDIDYKSRRLFVDSYDRSFRIAVKVNVEDSEIVGLGVNSYYNGELFSSQGGQNADNSPLAYGDSLTFEITEDELQMAELESLDVFSGYSFSLSGYDLSGNTIFELDRKQIKVRFGETYVYSLVKSGGEYKLITEN